MPLRYQNNLALGLKPDPLITYTEWANEKFELPKESAAEYGRYRSARTPFVEEILDVSKSVVEVYSFLEFGQRHSLHDGGTTGRLTGSGYDSGC